jgi:hypothetical protein
MEGRVDRESANQQVLIAQVHAVRTTRLALYALSGLLVLIATGLLVYAHRGNGAGVFAYAAIAMFVVAIVAAHWATFSVEIPAGADRPEQSKISN